MPNTLNLPSQKLFLIFIPVIALVGIFVMFKGSGTGAVKSSQSQTQDAPQVVAIQNNIIATVDTDSDGVPDWEEIVWHTDPNNASTYGMPDKDYIAQQMAQGAGVNSTSTTISNTDALSQQLFTRYMSLQSSGQLNQDTVDSMTADIAANIPDNQTGATYGAQDIKTFPDSDAKGIQNYAETITSLYQQYSSSYLAKYPNTTLEPEDPAFADNASTIGDYYNQFAQALVAIPVPAGALSAHLAYVNAIKDSGTGLKLMGSMKTEPLNALLGLKQYIDSQDTQASAIVQLNNYLSTNGIVNQAINPF